MSLRLFFAALFFLIFAALPTSANAQILWNKDGNAYTTIEDNAIVEITLPAMTKTTLVSAGQLAPLGLPTRERPEAARTTIP